MLVDLRDDSERERHGIIPGSVHVPYPDLETNVKPGALLHELAVSTDKLLVVACEPVAQILSVDVGAYPHCSNAHAYLVRGGQVIFHGQDDVVAEIRKFL